MQGLPVPASAMSDERSRRLKRSLSQTLSVVRRVKGTFSFADAMLVFFSFAATASAFVGVHWWLGKPFVAAFAAGAIAALVYACLTIYRGRHWRRAAVPPAAIRVDEVLLASCRHCDDAIRSPARSMVFKCKLCRTRSLVPAPLISARAYKDYGEMLSRLRSVASPTAARMAAGTFRSESVGWVLVSLAAAGAGAWLVAAESGIAQLVPFLEGSLGRIGVPAGFAAILGGLGIWDTIRSRRRRERAQRAFRLSSY